MTQTATAATCTLAELAFLAGLLGADTLVGIPDPFHGLLAAEVEEALTHARTTLGQRGLLAVEPDGSIQLDERLAQLVEACAFARASLLVSTGEHSPSHQFHAGLEGALVEVTVDPQTRQATLRAIDDPVQLSERLTSLLPLDGKPAAPGGTATVKEATLTSVRRAARDYGEASALRLLKAAGVPDEAAAALARALAKPALSGALIYLARQGEGMQSEGLGLLAGEPGLWRLTAIVRSDERWIELNPCTGTELADEVRTLATHIKGGLHK